MRSWVRGGSPGSIGVRSVLVVLLDAACIAGGETTESASPDATAGEVGRDAAASEGARSRDQGAGDRPTATDGPQTKVDAARASDRPPSVPCTGAIISDDFERDTRLWNLSPSSGVVKRD